MIKVTVAPTRGKAGRVDTLHRHVLHHPRLAAWLVAAALLMKVLVPSGFMPGMTRGALVLELCAGYGPVATAMPMPGMMHHDKAPHHGKAEQPCAFAALGAPALAGADPVLLALAIAFVFAALFRMAARPAPRQRPHLRPPLRGPPPLT